MDLEEFIDLSMKKNKTFLGVCAKNSYVRDGKVYVNSKDDIRGVLDYSAACDFMLAVVQEHCRQIDNFLNKLQKKGCDLKNFNNFTRLQYEPYPSKVDGYLTAALIFCQKYCEKLKTNSDMYKNLLDQINNEINHIKNRLSDSYFYNIVLKAASYALTDEDKIVKGQILTSDTPYTVNDAYSLIEKYIPKDCMKENSEIVRRAIIETPTALIKRLEKGGYIKARR